MNRQVAVAVEQRLAQRRRECPNAAELRQGGRVRVAQGADLNDLDGEVEADTNVVIEDFDIDSIIVASEAIGNSALLSNQGADTWMGMTQDNRGNVRSTTTFEGGVGGEVTGSASARVTPVAPLMCRSACVNSR